MASGPLGFNWTCFRCRRIVGVACIPSFLRWPWAILVFGTAVVIAFRWGYNEGEVSHGRIIIMCICGMIIYFVPHAVGFLSLRRARCECCGLPFLRPWAANEYPTATIKGKVVDGEGYLLRDITVGLERVNKAEAGWVHLVTTDADGCFEMCVSPGCSWRVTALCRDCEQPSSGVMQLAPGEVKENVRLVVGEAVEKVEH